jgi:hypothetical protein
MTRDNSLNVAAALVALVTILGMSGCTYMIMENNRMYYDSMNVCIQNSGTFVPTRGGSSEAVCVMSAVGQNVTPNP